MLKTDSSRMSFTSDSYLSHSSDSLWQLADLEDQLNFLYDEHTDDVIQQGSVHIEQSKDGEVCVEIPEKDIENESDDYESTEPDIVWLIKNIFISEVIVKYLIEKNENPTHIQSMFAVFIGFMVQSGLVVLSAFVSIVITVCMIDRNNYKTLITILTIVNILILLTQSFASNMGMATSIIEKIKKEKERERLREAKEKGRERLREAKEKERERLREAKEKERDVREKKKEKVLLDKMDELKRIITDNGIQIPNNLRKFDIDRIVDSNMSKYRIDEIYEPMDFMSDSDSEHDSTVQA